MRSISGGGGGGRGGEEREKGKRGSWRGSSTRDRIIPCRLSIG